MLAGERLKQQHRDIDVEVEAAARGQGDATRLAAALRILRRHLYLEEHLLFPPLANSGLAMPVFVMKRDHGQMWPLLEKLMAACMVGVAAGALEGDGRDLLQILQMHNPKEEAVIYPAADQLADASLQDALEKAEPPEGWRCEMAR
ncbi:MAG: hemerythrin domain-containing protein [Nevskiaceae bacterium]|nr:MAG: hemerythrin domain-containing protein [Nevskiaceae bacterium]TBR74793.1 MAG: hemerythrin domain-containing protein [Nevskiaceae bacterium]